MAADPIDPVRVREAVAKAREVMPDQLDSLTVERLAAAALDALTQRDTVRELSEATAGLAEALKCVDQTFDEGRTLEGGFKRNPREIALKALRKLESLKSELSAIKKLDDHTLATTEQALLRAKCERGHERIRAEEAEQERDQLRSELEAARAERDRLQELDRCVRAAHFLSLNANDVWAWASADACQFDVDTGLDLLLEMRQRWGNEGELAFMAEGEGLEPQAPLLAKLGAGYREAREFVRGKETGVFRSMAHSEQQLAAQKKENERLRTQLSTAQADAQRWRKVRAQFDDDRRRTLELHRGEWEEGVWLFSIGVERGYPTLDAAVDALEETPEAQKGAGR